jgi:ribosome-binding ATPase YchF (GTP1/OBG family)
MESEIVVFSQEEQLEYLKQYGLTESGLNRLIKKAYKTLGLISFLTAGTLEVRAWTIKKGALAPQAAGVIHTDFEKHFIKADVIPYQTFVETGGWTAAREKGLVQTVGRDYEMKDGDVVEFKVSV